MIGTAQRKIAEEKVKNSNCPHCNESNTLVATVFSKFFMLKILPFAMGKTTEVNCSHCKKDFRGERLEVSIQRRVDVIKDDAKHPWFLYIGYAFIALAFIVGLAADKK